MVKTEIQKKIIEVIEAGTFPMIRYDENTPIVGENYTEEIGKPIVWVNETAAQINDSAKDSGRDRKYNLSGWNFEARIKFKTEVDTSYFVTNELCDLTLHVEGYMVRVKTGGYNVMHPPTGGPPTGTQIVLNLTANTRR